MGREYSLTEIFAIKFVLADIVIIAALLFAGPRTAIAITALLLASVFLVWFLVRKVESPEATEVETVDPVTRLQDRYAAGEITEAEFEERLEALIDANERAERAGVDTEELSLERST